MRRFGLYSYYSEQFIVSTGDIIYINSMKPYITKLIIVINGRVSPMLMEYFDEIADRVIMRPNSGYDAGAFKDVLLNYISYEELEKYDELILFNNTVFGPLCDMADIFSEMENSDCDFWGLRRNIDTTVPAHIQSYFLAFSRNVFSSDVFRKFWENLRTDYTHVFCMSYYYEIALSIALESTGFRGSGFSEGAADIYRYPAQVIFDGFPFIKKKVLRDTRKGTREEIIRLHDVVSKRSPDVYKAMLEYENIYDFWPDLLPAGQTADSAKKYSNDELLDIIAGYDSVYFLGITNQSLYLIEHCNAVHKAFIESDEYYKPDPALIYPIYDVSDVHPLQNSLCVCMLRPEAISESIESIRDDFESFLNIYKTRPVKKSDKLMHINPVQHKSSDAGRNQAPQ